MKNANSVTLFEIVITIALLVIVSSAAIVFFRATEASAHNKAILSNSAAFLSAESAQAEHKLMSMESKFSIETASSETTRSVTIGQLDRNNCIDLFMPFTKRNIDISVNGGAAQRVADIYLCENSENNQVTFTRNISVIGLSPSSQKSTDYNESTAESF